MSKLPFAYQPSQSWPQGLSNHVLGLRPPVGSFLQTIRRHTPREARARLSVVVLQAVSSLLTVGRDRSLT